MKYFLTTTLNSLNVNVNKIHQKSFAARPSVRVSTIKASVTTQNVMIFEDMYP